MSNKCPNCNNDADLSKGNDFRPFCSEKCKLIDFGALNLALLSIIMSFGLNVGGEGG